MSSSSISPTHNNPNRSSFVSEDLVHFIRVIDNYKPTIPEAVTKYYMEKSGCTVTDSRVLKLVSLAADKFLAELTYEAKEQAILKSSNPKNKRKHEANVATALDIYDVEGSLSQSNIFWRRSLRRKTVTGVDGIKAVEDSK